MKNRQKGSIEVIIMVILIVLVLGIGAWWVWHQNRDSGEDAAARYDIGLFSPSFTTLVADAQGYLDEENVEVDYHSVDGSEQQFESLREGEYDLIMTAPDNVLEYRLNDDNELGGTFDVQAIAASNRGNNLSLMVQPEIETYEDLRGKTLAVDSPNSGFAYVLYQMMSNNGLELNEDYQIAEAGGSVDRETALINGDFDGTLLLSGQELVAEEQGMRVLDVAAESIPNYLGGVIAARESWLGDNRDGVERLLRAYQKANDWFFDPSNHEAAIQLLIDQTGASREAAEKTYEIQISPETGLVRDQMLTPDNLRVVLNLRQDWGGFDEPQDIDYLASPESGLYDTSYLE